MAVEETTIKYGEESARQIIRRWKLGVGARAGANPSMGHVDHKPRRAIILIHGGAWRDPNNTCNDFQGFVNTWAGITDYDGLVAYSIDYKLSSEVGGTYPSVVLDVFKALEIIHKDFRAINGTDDVEYTLCGHSVGCTFITQIMEYEKYVGANQRPAIMDHIRKCVFLDGIYCIRELNDEYPEYAFFIEEQFGNMQVALAECNSVGNSVQAISVRELYRKLNEIVIVHSTEDELLSLRQPQMFHTWLVDVCAVDQSTLRTHYAAYGRHNDVYENAAVAVLI